MLMCDYCGKIRHDTTIGDRKTDWTFHAGSGKTSCPSAECWSQGFKESQEALDTQVFQAS